MCVVHIGTPSRPSRATSVPPPFSAPPSRGFSVPPRDLRASSVQPNLSPLSPLDLMSEYERDPFNQERGLSPTPVKAGRWGPRSSEVAFDTEGNSFDF